MPGEIEYRYVPFFLLSNDWKNVVGYVIKIKLGPCWVSWMKLFNNHWSIK